MSTIHFVLQGKGGVGKSLVASLLFQYLNGQGLPVSGVDTDPVNSTFSGYKELNIQPLNIMDGDDIDQRRFDSLMEIIFQQPKNSHIVIDNGAATFVPLCSYLKENSALDLLCNEGHDILLHTVITGGQAVVDTSAGLKTLAISFPTAPLVVWLNRYFGDITLQMAGHLKNSKSTRNTAANSARSSKFRTANTPLSARTWRNCSAGAAPLQRQSVPVCPS